MTRKFALASFGLTLLIAWSLPAFSSGSYGGGTSSYNRDRPVRQVDQNYEAGKAIFTGRKSSAGKLDYCVAVDGELKKIKRSSLKDYKRTSYDEVANNLFDCNEPETKIAEKITRDELLYVLYYLNKRFRLYLG